MPGNNGGANWGGAAVDPTNGRLYVVSKDLPAMLKLEPEKTAHAAPADSPEQRGLLIYQAQCQSCHLADRRGKPPAMPSLLEVGLRLTREQIINATRQGQGPMPGFPNLTGEEMNSLLAYLYNPTRASLSQPAGDEPESGETRYVSGFGFMIASNGLSPIAPPWSSLTVFDLNEGTIRWKMPLGDVPDLAAKGIRNTGTHYPKVGPIVTAGGLLFAGTRDKQVRAFDVDDGKVLWEANVDSALEGIPAVYQAGGRQFIVFCAAAQAGLTRSTQVPVRGAYVAFALPVEK
jgi:quinoprotein glucose dehydrogenase